MDENTTSSMPDDGQTFRELALRLLAARFGGGSGFEPRLLPGALPPDLPFTLPIPDGARLLGTLLLGLDEPAASHLGDATVMLDTALPADDVIAFYRTRLPPEGWTEEVLPFRQGGFMPAGAERAAMVNFDHGEQGPSLRIMYMPALDDHNTVQIVIAKRPAISPHMRRRQMMSRDFMRVLPALMAPAGSTQLQGGGGSSSDEHVDTRATMESDLDVPTVGAHYSTQIERAGWEARGGGASGPVAWSTWEFKDEAGEPWSAIFTAIQQHGAPRRYHLYLGADYAGSDEGRSSMRLLGTQSHSTGWTHHGPTRRGH